MSGWEKAGDGCTCSVNPNPFTHYGATEPGDALEPDPECPKHFPTRTIEQEAQAEAERRIDENAWLFRRDTEAGWFLNGFIKGAEWGASRPVTDAEVVEQRGPTCSTCDDIGLVGSNHENSGNCPDCNPRRSRSYSTHRREPDMSECCASGSCEVCRRPSGYSQAQRNEIRDYEPPWVRQHREEGWR